MPWRQALSTLSTELDVEVRAGGIEVGGPPSVLVSPLGVGELAIASIAAALLAGAELAEARGASRPVVGLDTRHVEASFTSEQHVRLESLELGAAFDPLSSWMRTADGWIRTHANYPHHRAALLAALGLDAAVAESGANADSVRAAVAERGAEELERAIFETGGCAGALRDRSGWENHPQGRLLTGTGLLDVSAADAEAPPLPELPAGALPAAGLRVLDLTRVIAGPVGARTLAALGADVLRIDAPGAPELERVVIDTGPGKRSARLDLRTSSGAETFESLLADADVLIEGYRPGALEALGFGALDIAARHPRLVTITLSAWGENGPWGQRRGFDSLVQSATGIAAACTPPGADLPGSLPAQALDHGTGHLIAAAALRGLSERARHGRALHARLALARTARWLLDLPRADINDRGTRAPIDPTPFMTGLPSPRGMVTVVAPAGTLDHAPLRWERGPVPIGSDRAAWAPVR